jgi:ABC-type transport system substrate-binding protein
VPKLEVEPFRDSRVRRALHMAVNLDEVIKVNPKGTGTALPIPSSPPRYGSGAIPIASSPGGPAAL